MKILYVLDTFYPKVDGPATVINNIASISAKHNLAQIDLLVPHYPKYKDKFKYRVIRVPSIFGPDKYRTGLPQLKCNLKKLLKQEKYDIIHVHSPFTMGKWAINFAKKNGIPSINTLHTRYKSDFERKLKSKTLQNFMMRYVKNVLNKSDHVLTVSQGFANEIQPTYNYNKKVNVIRNATEFKGEFTPELVEELREKHNLKKEFICLFVGRVVENKNIQFSLKSLSELKKRGVKNFKFIIVGEGNYKSTLEELVKEYKLEENVIFAGLIKDRKLLGAYYQLSDLFLFPSTFDTCGIVALEAASFKLPSLMLEKSYASELIENNINGFTEPEDPVKWADKLETLIKDRKIIANTKEAVKQSLCKSWEEITLESVNYYKYIILFHKLKKKNYKELFVNKKLKKAKCKFKSVNPFKR